MKNKIRKNIFIILLVLLSCLFFNKVEAIEGTIDGGGQSAENCASCTWWYSLKGLKVSLYQYDGKTLKYHKSVDVLNAQMSDIAIWIGDQAARFEYKGEVAKFPNLIKGSHFYWFGQEDTPFENFDTINSEDQNPYWAVKKQQEFIEYFGDNLDKNIEKIKEMFGNDIGVNETNVAEFYIVLEPSIIFLTSDYVNYYYCTAYEAMTLFNRSTSFAGQQTITIRDFLYNGMYVSQNAERLFDATTGRYDENNFINESENKDGLIVAASGLTTFDDIKVNYKKSDYPYGIGVLWIVSESKGKGCTNVCGKKTGDDLLKCAENFCAKSDGVKDSDSKRACIINQCKYETTPLTCSNIGTNNGIDTVCSDTTGANKNTCTTKNQNGISYKIECNTTSNVIFPDTLPKTIIPGEGFEYQVKLYGNKECTITLDVDKWKLDYASSYEKAERDNLVDAIKSFNNKKFTDLSYASENAVLKLEIDEARTNSDTVTTSINLIAQDKYNSGNKDVTQTKNTKKIKSYYTENGVSKEIEISAVTTYETDSSNETLYDIEKVCISPEDNITIIEGSTCDNDLGPHSKYYSSTFAEKTDHNPSKTEVSHEISGLNVNNTCHFAVTPDELSCNIAINNECSNYLYANQDIVFTLTANYNRNRDKTISYNIGKTKLSEKNPLKYNGLTKYTISKNTIKEPTEVTVYGTVTDGKNIKHCSKTITVLPNTNKCTFEKKENPTDNTVTVSIKSVENPNAVYQIKDSTSNKWMDIQSKTIKKDEHIILQGRVIVNGVTYQDCFYEYPPTTNCEKCVNKFKPTEYQKIKEYCTNNWQSDGAGYTSYDNCYSHCSSGGTTNTCKNSCDTKDLTCIKNYCKDKFGNDGYLTYGDCINDCSDPNDGLNYFYRTISNNNPFPQREAHYNWLGYEEYITNDKEDLTPSVGGAAPEYEIKLDKDRIKIINDNISKYNNSGDNKSAYSDYMRVDKNNAKYKSKFIHEDDPLDGGFKSYFTYIEGSKVGG